MSEQAETIEIPEELQAEIRELARELPTLDYFGVLGVGRDASTQDVRDAFVVRSKAFHPDRYFGKHLGAYEGLLREVYKRVVEAHEVLRDPEQRTDYEKTL